ncbi:hypothetical protein [Cryobacterium sp. PH31-L1]|uniref:hypothetical protein n=1 Tax=Cryobacterium sp. PH31-L1 TaxID=3046199 RepID=UPI0024BB5E61|nr:hypothetical protein [Cryobacterium sp. PH31-L1]MDJ0379202.1 hypothetical protein [Cryobacterium sp. PH31-L1]
MRNLARIASLATAFLAAGMLAGCAAVAPGGAPDTAVATTVPSAAAEPPEWPSVSEAGTGPTTFTIPNPSPDALYLLTEFTCSSGEFDVVLVESSSVFMAGTCGGSGGYQMTLPTNEDQYTITVDVEQGESFTFTGRFSKT